MNYWLSVLIPSVRPESLERFMESAMYNSYSYNNIQFIILTDGDVESTTYEENIVRLVRKKQEKLNVAALQYECSKYALADWIMLGNDDVIIDTKGWDGFIQAATKMHDDEIALIWPDDDLFGQKLSCFPIISRKVFDKIFPLPYQRYKVDDTIFWSFPDDRKIYLGNVKFRHLNTNKEAGHPLGDGRFYTIIPQIGYEDEQVWSSDEEVIKRYRIRRWMREQLGIKQETTVLVAISTMEMARRADFYDHLNQMVKLPNTRYIAAHGQSPARARNLIFKEAFDKDCTHVLLLDDDVAFKPDLLTTLLKHDKDVVCGLQLMRAFPHLPIIFDEFDERGHARWLRLSDGMTGLVPIVAAGLGCSLINVRVLENMERPWVRLGELESDNWCDDIGFWLRMRRDNKVFSMYCDLDAPVGHNVNLTIWPNNINGVWHTSYDSGGSGVAHIAQEKPLDSNRTNQNVEQKVA